MFAAFLASVLSEANSMDGASSHAAFSVFGTGSRSGCMACPDNDDYGRIAAFSEHGGQGHGRCIPAGMQKR